MSTLIIVRLLVLRDSDVCALLFLQHSDFVPVAGYRCRGIRARSYQGGGLSREQVCGKLANFFEKNVLFSRHASHATSHTRYTFTSLVVAAVITFRIVDAARAVLDIESLDEFVRVQAHAILKRICSLYPYISYDGTPSLSACFSRYLLEHHAHNLMPAAHSDGGFASIRSVAQPIARGCRNHRRHRDFVSTV